MISSFRKTNLYFSLIVIVIFLVILLNSLMKEGMFMDGLIYSTISRNISIGIGSLWFPKFSETIFPVFNEHPPLVFGIQSVFFKIFGTSIYVERLYTFFTAIVTLVLIKYLWKLVFKKTEVENMWWLAVLFWIITPVVFWSYSNNMLECTMGIFTLSAVISSIKYVESVSKYKFLYLFVVALFIVLGLLSKGFPALFPIAVIPIYWLVYKKHKLINIVFSTFSVIFLVLLIVYLLMLNNDVNNNLMAYFNSQVLESIAGQRNPGSRMFIVFRLLRELLAMLSLSSIIFILSYLFKTKLKIDGNNKKIFIFALLIGLSASLPVAISPKQMGFYILPSFPFFAIAFASLIVPILHIWISKIKNILSLKILSAILVIVLFSVAYTSIGKYNRDKNTILDIKKLTSIVPENTLIATDIYFYNKWSFVSYLYRYNLNSIDKTGNKSTYYIAKKEEKPMTKKYTKVQLQFNEFDLYKIEKDDKNK